jgi:hypothetical protein
MKMWNASSANKTDFGLTDQIVQCRRRLLGCPPAYEKAACTDLTATWIIRMELSWLRGHTG